MSKLQHILSRARRQINKHTKFDIVRSTGHHSLRTHLPVVLDAYSIDTIIDVGANEGDFGLHVRDLGFRGSIVSFEPVQGAFEVLAERASRDSGWTAHKLALGSQPGEAIINVSRFSQFSSLLKASDYGNTWKNMKVEKTETIQVRTLDQVASEGLIPHQRAMLKMDTQGFDLEVFKGSKNTLPSIPVIQSELSLIPLYETMPHYLAALSEYESNGYSVSGFYPITRNARLALNEVDCVLVRQ